MKHFIRTLALFLLAATAVGCSADKSTRASPEIIYFRDQSVVFCYDARAAK